MAYRILVVDDETAIREAIRMTLEYEGYKIDEARSGQEGLDKASKTDYDAILLDIKMPVLEGSRSPETLKIKITSPGLRVSGHATFHRGRMHERGAFDFRDSLSTRQTA